MIKVIISFILVYGLQAQASQKCSGNVEFDDFVTIIDDNKKEVDLELNGIGLMEVFVFKVFYVAFYVENPTQNAEALIASDEHKVGIIHALRNIEKKRLVDMWDDEFNRLCADKCDEMRPHHEKFLSYARDVQKDERLYTVSFKDRFEFETSKGEIFDPIYSPDYGRLLQHSLFGPDPANQAVADGVLGKKKVCRGSLEFDYDPLF